jgi:DNA-binding transcriptional ArsR family regulator
MVSNSALDQVFGALADPTRRVILEQLTEGQATVGELAQPFEMSRPAVSKHLRVLERAGLVERTIDGRITRCSLSAGPMQGASEWVDRYREYWDDQLDRFKRYLEDPATPSESSDNKKKEEKNR